MKQPPLDGQNLKKFASHAQVGGIETSILDDGPSRGCRIAWVNTGSPLRYKVVLDRGMDIADAFYGPCGLAWLSYGGVTRPEPAGNVGVGWLKGFFGGLLTSCGPMNVGAACSDAGQDLPLHGTHSHTPATVESILQPDPQRGRLDFSITGVVKTTRLFGPNVELRRTLSGRLGKPEIVIRDEFFNRGNAAVPHAWLLHINLGWPLLDEGTRFIFAGTVTPRADSAEWFGPPRNPRIVPPMDQGHSSTGEAVAYVEGGANRDGLVRVAAVNDRLGLGMVVTFYESQFPRWVNWQHFAPGEFVAAIEPANSGVEGRDVDRQRGWMDSLAPQESRLYETKIEILDDPEMLRQLDRTIQG